MPYSIFLFQTGMSVFTPKSLITIAILGGGPTGVSLCLQLNQALNALKPNARISILVFEKQTEIGFGLPYSIPEDAFCINLPKEYMALTPGEYHHFSAWLTERYPAEGSTFPPRHYFGEYAQERLRTINTSPELEIIPRSEHAVFDVLAVDNNHYQIHAWHKKKKVTYDVNYVIVATGHLPSDLFAHLHTLRQCQSNPWDMSRYQNIPTHHHVGIIGTRLTAIDVALKLNQQRHQGKISMISRHGLLSAVRGTHAVPKLQYLIPENIQRLLHSCNSKTLLPSLIQLLEQDIAPYLPPSRSLAETLKVIKTLNPTKRINQEIQQAEANNTAWQSVLSCFYQIIFRIWPTLPPLQQRHFLETYSSVMLTFLCSFPLNSAYVIQSMMQSRQLSIHKGLASIEKTPTDFSIRLGQGKSLRCDNLILATGSGDNPETVPLLANMLKRQLLKKHDLGGICIDTKTYQVLTENPISPSQIYALGDLVKGACFKMIELGQVVEQARIVTNHIVKKISSVLAC